MAKSYGALLTDLYQLNMMAAYLEHNLTETAVFELFVRKLPPRRGFLMAAGLDSGDLGAHAVRVRRILDEGGLRAVKIVASGGLDEDALLALRARAPIDSYGVGTSLTTASDVPALDCAYKFQEFAGAARRKRSEGKATWPGRKQVWRSYDEDGRLAGDLVSLVGDLPKGEALLRPVMRGGRRLADIPDLSTARDHAKDQLAWLPAPLAHLEAYHYRVEIGAPLRELAIELDRRAETDGEAA